MSYQWKDANIETGKKRYTGTLSTILEALRNLKCSKIGGKNVGEKTFQNKYLFKLPELDVIPDNVLKH